MERYSLIWKQENSDLTSLTHSSMIKVSSFTSSRRVSLRVGFLETSSERYLPPPLFTLGEGSISTGNTIQL